MNRFINAVLLFFTLITAFVAIYVGFDLPFGILKTTGADIPYVDYVFHGLGLFLFIIVLRRSYRRWMAIRIVSRLDKFKWNKPVSKERKVRVIIYNILEFFVYVFAGSTLYWLTDRAWAPVAALLFAALDNLILTALNKTYRVGLTSKAVIVADREVVVLYFTGLRKVSLHQQTVYFDYIKDLQLSFPTNCLLEEQRSEFFDTLEQQVDRDKVYFSKTDK
ncbi:MAG: hypothetical protein DCO96_13410 [Fluviicola sp. XM-24bin1]|nr:MAG: hypothetical protein DCO96_13410 [Fluviicola sp. XM-24bin1]